MDAKRTPPKISKNSMCEKPRMNSYISYLILNMNNKGFKIIRPYQAISSQSWMNTHSFAPPCHAPTMPRLSTSKKLAFFAPVHSPSAAKEAVRLLKASSDSNDLFFLILSMSILESNLFKFSFVILKKMLQYIACWN